MSDATPMDAAELGLLLNRLLEAERAGARTLRVYLEELDEATDAHRSIRAIQGDEARNCLTLLELLRSTGVEPSLATGSFYEKAIAIRGWDERLAFLNRGQEWVARHIAKALPRIPGKPEREALSRMHASHLANIAACEALRQRWPAPPERHASRIHPMS
jgi:nitronate monooxygenase